MYIQNATYKAVPTAGLTFPLAEGTVLTVGDVTGIVPENISLDAPTAQIYVAVGGTIDLTSEANKGVSFTDAQIKALGSDFNFVPASEKELPTPTLADAGKVVAVNETGTEYELVESGGGGGSSLPSYTDADKGKVLGLAEDGGSVAPAWVSGGGAVNLVYDENTGEINASYNDLSGYLQDGKIVQFLISGQDGATYYTSRYVLSSIYIYEDGSYYGVFSSEINGQLGTMAFYSETATDNLVYD